jgi:uncharacterized repeat protein (TIGR03803 family)
MMYTSLALAAGLRPHLCATAGNLAQGENVMHLSRFPVVCIVAGALAVAAKCAQAQTFTVLHSFTKDDGANPRARLVKDAKGNLYGTTTFGGSSAGGVVFKLDATGTETVLHSFVGSSDGFNPEAGLVLDAAGNLYGPTTWGGTPGHGTVFKVDANGTETVLYSFTRGADGGNPESDLIQDTAGNLYGTAFNGGSSDQGTVFMLDTSGTETVLHTFSGSDGGNPLAGVTRDAAGDLYGTTVYGGVYGNGTAWKLDANGTETVLYSFSGGTDGGYPDAGVIQDAAGNLYGTTSVGGSMSLGTVWKLDATGTETVLYSFSGPDGANPFGGLVRDAGGNFYGTTQSGGASKFGTVWKLDATGTETVLHNFTGGSDGASPSASLIFDATGNLYGTAYSGGAKGFGVVFEEIAGSDLSLVVAPNVRCKSSWGPCSGNIVLANSTETTSLTAIVTPPQQAEIVLSVDFGQVTDILTNNSGFGTGTYTAGILNFGFRDTKTATGIVNGMIGSQQFPSLTNIFNYAAFNFHQSQVTDTEFTDTNTMSAQDIQSFFQGYGSFMSEFVLISKKGGFIDSNNNGRLDAGETVYVSKPPHECPAPCGPFKLGATGTAASVVFKNAAMTYGLNPQILLATAEKENSLVSDQKIPSASVLNFAMGCNLKLDFDFLSQIACSANSFVLRFKETPSEPFFFKEPKFNVQHYVTGLKLRVVAFEVQTAATYAQYRYTPFIQAKKNGGGVYLFERLWAHYGF